MKQLILIALMGSVLCGCADFRDTEPEKFFNPKWFYEKLDKAAP